MTNRYIVPSQDGRTAIVTGASSGIGLWTATGLAKAGAHVVMVCRHAQRGENAKAFVTKASGRAPYLIFADFADLKTVRDAAAKITARYARIHILVNNAGLFSRKRELTKDGYEMTFAVNHLAPFLFTDRVLPALERGGEAGRHARIVTVASAAANRANVALGDLMSTRHYSMFGANRSSPTYFSPRNLPAGCRPARSRRTACILALSPPGSATRAALRVWCGRQSSLS